MDNSAVQLVGTPCGQHGPYTFYKAFKYAKNGLKRIVKLSEFFFVKLWSDSDLVCIGELQLLWVDKNSEQVLSSLRLYFLPENTPEGRMDHGEDEVLAISEKVVLRLEDLITWITVDAEWTWGRRAKWEVDVKEPKTTESNLDVNVNLTEGSLDFSDIEKEQVTNDEKCINSPSVIILSYPSYCRYRAMMKRLEGVEDDYLKHTIVKILGGFSAPNNNTRVLFCRDTFDYPELEGHELLCNHLAPKLKGRPRGRRKKRSLSPGSESNESESSVSNVFSSTKIKIMTEGSPNGLRDNVSSPRRSTRSVVGNSESKDFLKKLHAFMKANHTPIGRIPSLGYRELDLHSFFTKVDKLGGYDAVTTNRLWKSIFDDLSGNYISTSAATVIRRHYERFLLPYERHIKGEEYKSSTSSIKRTKSNSGSGSDADTSESTSCSGNSTPVPQLTIIPLPSNSTDSKECHITEKSEKVKTSSLRSVRVKPERLREQALKDKAAVAEKSANLESNSKLMNEYSVEIKTESVSPPRNTNDGGFISSGLSVELIHTGVPTIPQKNVKSETIEISADATVLKNTITSDTAPTSIEKITLSQSFSNSPVSVTLQKSVTDKLGTVADGKENIATCNTNSVSGAHSCKDIDNDLTEVPYKSKTPETVYSESEVSNNVIANSTLNSSLLHSVKKRKLEILKEGGLEVTPVKPATAETKEIKESRPSVIHHPGGIPKATVGQLSITIASDKQGTLISSNSMEVSQRAVTSQTNDIQTLPSTSIMRSNAKLTNKNATPSNSAFLYLNGQSPPKVVQSKSIYSYSEKTVYGNPKDYFMPPPRPPPQAPKFVETPAKQMGGEILDLTIRSPQKPVVEIMRVPNVASRVPMGSKELSSRRAYRNSAALPVLDARVGSNLEITLVGPNSTPHSIPQTNKLLNRYNCSSTVAAHGHHPSMHSSTSANHFTSAHGSYNINNKTPQKRTYSGSFVTNKKEENGRLPYSVTPTQQAYAPREHRNQNCTDFNTANSYNSRNSISKLENSRSHVKSSPQPSTNLKPYTSTPSSILPGYLTQLSLASKMMPPYVPPIDPLYYSALQSLYPHNPLSSVPPFFPVPTPDQLQFYTDLMTRNSQMRFPFPYPQDGNSSVTTANTESNNYKKQ